MTTLLVPSWFMKRNRSLDAIPNQMNQRESWVEARRRGPRRLGDQHRQGQRDQKGGGAPAGHRRPGFGR
jgi:hypothetical protein